MIAEPRRAPLLDGPSSWRYLPWGFLAAVLLLYAQAALFTPNEYGDHFQEIAAAYDHSLGELLTRYLGDRAIFFRPLEIVWHKVAFRIFEERLLAFNLFQMLLLAVIGGALVLSFRARSLGESIAALFALACLFGYHGFQGLLELNLAISNLVVVTLITLSLLLLSSPPRRWSGACAVVLSLVAILTKEVGIVVPFLFLLAWVAGYAVPGRRTALAIGLVLAAFIAFRLAAVVMADDLQDPAHGREARDLGAFAVNILASFLNRLSAVPRSGDFGALIGGLRLPPWRIFQILMPLLAFLLIGLACVERRVWSASGDRELRRRTILLIGVVALSSGLGFFYPVDRQAAIVAPLLAYTLCLSVTRLLAGPEAGVVGCRRLVFLLAALAFVSTMRTIGGYYFLLGNARLIQDDWVLNMAHYETQYAAGHDDRGRHLEEFRSASLGMPRATRHSIERELFGSGKSVAR